MECPVCQCRSLRRNGHYRTIQRFQCKRCGRQFLESYRQARYSEEMKQSCLQLYLEGWSIRAISKVTQVHPTTLSRWLQRSDLYADLNQAESLTALTISLSEDTKSSEGR